MDKSDVRYIIVHDQGASGDPSAAAIRRDHVQNRGWADIGYHWVIRKNGDVEAGRPESRAGAHAAGPKVNIPNLNAHSLGVMITDQLPINQVPQAQRQALVEKLAQLCVTYNVPIENVRGHGEVEPGNSDFPGSQMATLRPLVQARIVEIQRDQGNQPATRQAPTRQAPTRQAPAGEIRPEAPRGTPTPTPRPAAPTTGDGATTQRPATPRPATPGAATPAPGIATGILRPPVSTPIGSGNGSDYGSRPTEHLPRGASANHPGVDYPVRDGTPVRAADGGRVIFAGRAGTAGNTVVIDHGNGMVTRYLHQSRIDVRVGDPVAQGAVIGRSGHTGLAGIGPHLHFELRKGGTTDFRRDGHSVDPEFLFGHPYAGATPGVVGRGAARGTQGTPASTPPASNPQPASPQTSPAAGQTATRPAPTTTPGATTPGATTPGATTPGMTTPGATSRAIDTAGPFAATSVGALVGPAVPAARSTSLGALDATQSYALGRAVFGDGPGAAALQRVDQQLGNGSGVFVQRMVALGQHEGALNFGRTNADPRSGSNVGTFQVGGAGTTPAVTRQRYEGFVTRGIREYEALGGPRVDATKLSPADRDIFAHIAHMTNKAEERRLPANTLLRQMSDPTIRGAALATLVSDRVQVGEPGIGKDVVRMTDRTNGMRVDRAAVAARGTEPDATRREPAMPVLDRRLQSSFSPAVAQWQAVLKAQGQNIGADRPNGIYNAATLASTRALQTRAGIRSDGTVGPATWARYAATGGREIEGAASPRPTTPGQTTPGATTPGQTAPESGHSGITRTLRQSDTGPEVSILQSHLHSLGYSLGTTGAAHDGVDGTFGPNTLAAVRKYQTDNGLPVTGVVDRATRGQLPVLSRASDSPEPATTAPATAPGKTTPQPTAPMSGDGASTPTPSTPQPTRPGETSPTEKAPGDTTPRTSQPTAPTSGDGAATVPPPAPSVTEPGTTAPGKTGPDGPHPNAGTFLREADGLVSNLLDRHVADVPGTLAALIEGTRGPGSGDLGRTTPDDVQRLFAQATAGSATLPLSRTEAGLIAGVLDERSRLVGEGATPVPGGDGANRTPAAPTGSPAETPAQTATRQVALTGPDL